MKECSDDSAPDNVAELPRNTSMVEALRGQHAGLKVLVFDGTDDDQAIIECVRAGASGCSLQEASAED